MTTLGWLGWRSIWAPPKGGEAATVPCRLYVGVEVKMEALLQQLKPDYAIIKYAIMKLCG